MDVSTPRRPQVGARGECSLAVHARTASRGLTFSHLPSESRKVFICAVFAPHASAINSEAYAKLPRYLKYDS